MCREISDHRNQNVATLVAIPPFAELANAGLQHLVGVKSGVFAENSLRKGSDEPLGIMASKQITGDKPCRHVDLLLTVERGEKRAQNLVTIQGQIVESVAVLAWQALRRNVEIAGQINGHRTMEYSAHCLDVPAFGGRCRANPLEGLVHCVAIGESVMRSLPVAMLVRRAKPRNAQCRGIGERASQID